MKSVREKLFAWKKQKPLLLEKEQEEANAY